MIGKDIGSIESTGLGFGTGPALVLVMMQYKVEAQDETIQWC
jgi:hypothetical protein